MKKFNGGNMRGLTNEDNIKIIKCADKEILMFVDNSNRVITEGGQYIADCKIVKDGDGIYC